MRGARVRGCLRRACNVASERVFGVVRGLEDDQRRSASEETVTIETLARCNSWLVDVVREKHGRV